MFPRPQGASAGPDSRFAAAEGFVERHRVARVAGGLDRAEVAARASGRRGCRLLQGLEAVGVQHLGPHVGVVAGRVAAAREQRLRMGWDGRWRRPIERGMPRRSGNRVRTGRCRVTPGRGGCPGHCVRAPVSTCEARFLGSSIGLEGVRLLLRQGAAAGSASSWASTVLSRRRSSRTSIRMVSTIAWSRTSSWSGRTRRGGSGVSEGGGRDSTSCRRNGSTRTSPLPRWIS